jgi:hypothetical protein
VVRSRVIDATGPRGILKYRSRMVMISVAYAEAAPELAITLPCQLPETGSIFATRIATGAVPSYQTYLTKMASLMLNVPGFSSIPINHLPLGIIRSSASKYPKGYVTRMTK